MQHHLFKFLLILPMALVNCAESPNEENSSENAEGSNVAEVSSDAEVSDDNGGIELPDGFKATIFADDIGPARHLTVREDGTVYVALRRFGESMDGGGIVALQDTDGDGVADKTTRFGEVEGTGIEVYNGHLYFGAVTEVMRWKFNGDEVVPSGDKESIVAGFDVQQQHSSKPFTFDQAGNIYVNVGANSNACMEQTRTPGSPGMYPCPQLDTQAGIWRYDANKTGQQHIEDGRHYATGIRNAMALDWDTASNKLYMSFHGRDALSFLYPDMFNNTQSAELPSEEFHSVSDGDDFGWPYTYYDQIAGQRVLAPEYGGDGKRAPDGDYAADYKDPLIGFPGHWAPNDLLFYSGDMFPSDYKNGAFLVFHGSWNRAPLPQRGYNVVFIPMQGGAVAGDWEVFADGFKGVDFLASPGDAVHRPMGLAVGPDGALYISDDVGGRIWRVTYEDN